jgi:hypothetical protein
MKTSVSIVGFPAKIRNGHLRIQVRSFSACANLLDVWVHMYVCKQIYICYVRFEIFTAVTMKNAVFWGVAPCRICMNRRFGVTSFHTRSTRHHIPEYGILCIRYDYKKLYYTFTLFSMPCYAIHLNYRLYAF